MMFTTKPLPGLLAILLLAIAPGCFSGNQPPPQSISPRPTQPSPAPTPVAPAPPASELESPPDASAPMPPADRPPTPESTAPSQASAPDNCDNAQTQAEINQCSQASYQVADRELNRVYQELKASLNSQEQEELIDAELAWIEYRDQTCEAESSQYEGGSIQPTIFYGCLERVTAERTAELQRQLAQS